MKVRETYIDFYRPPHALKQGMKISVIDFSLVHPSRFTIVDFHTNPYPFHVFHARQQAGDEIWTYNNVLFLYLMEHEL